MNKQNLLKEKGLKSTNARVAVLDFLEEQRNPTDVYSIAEELNQVADQATIYRILEILTKNGIVNRLEFGEGKYRYELQRDHHHHMICENCGSIEDVEGAFVEELEKEIKDKKGFRVKSHSLEFFGICSDCQS
jgi:Fur family transcriptional regulator, ferric uptake regulator